MLQFIGLKYTSAASAITMVGLEPLLVVLSVISFQRQSENLPLDLRRGGVCRRMGMMVMGGAEEAARLIGSGCLLILLAGWVLQA